MAKLKVTSEWWTSPAESESGNLVIVTGRCDIENIKATGNFNDRIEISWKYEGDDKGMPDFATSSMMEKVTDAFNTTFDKDPVAVMTGIYTGDNLRNWIFYTQSNNIFGRKLNEALANFELLPINIYAEKDPEWEEYKEMCEQAEIMKGE
ncbi:MAG: DUF695 domain-containing protein [Muribaculaceae bacterium]|nr:DUF695 domain-containing protein [Muribaculaceae bacterium]